MALDINKIRNQQAELKRKGGDYFKCAKGPNKIRVFKFTHKVTKADVDLGYFTKDKIGKVEEELARPITRHFNIDPKNRPVLSTPALIERWKEKKKTDEEGALKIKPQTSHFLNVVDVNAPEKKMVPFGASKTVYNAILDYIIDPEYGESILGANGRDLIIDYNPTLTGTEMYKVRLREEKFCKPLPDGMEDEVLDFYNSLVQEKFAISVAVEEGSGEVVEETAEETEEAAEEIESEETLQPTKRKFLPEPEVEDPNSDESLEGVEEETEEPVPKKKKVIVPVKKKVLVKRK